MALTRRTFLRGSALVTSTAAATSLGLPAALARQDGQTPAGPDWVRVYLVVIDGLRPDEVGQMPTLTRLATEGWYYPNARAQMIAETTPNHVSMITGMRADRHGMPGNDAAYLADNIGLEPRYLQSDTIYSLIARQAPDLVATAATSKEYVVAMTKHMRVDPGTEDADATNDPFIVPVSGAAIDAEVGLDAVEQSQTFDPDFGWMSLGDVDRVGHSDESGATGGPPIGRSLALQTADQQVASLVEELQSSGRWDTTVMLVTADHSMDWSTPDSIVSLTGAFEEEAELAGQTGVAQNGGSAIYWLLAPQAPQAGTRLKRMREIALATEGVAEAWYTRPNPDDGDADHWVGRARPDWGLTGDRTGDLIVAVQDGYRITEPDPQSNPIPGNHGHVITLPIPQIIAGGWSGVNANDVTPATADLESIAPDERVEGQGENIDIAPTVAWLLGINPPPGDFDGRVLTEAFSRRPDPRLGVADVPSLPRYRTVEGATRLETAVALSQLAFPAAADADGNPTVETLVVASGEDFPDALAATPLAVAVGGPLLLTDADALPQVVADEIRRLSPSEVIVVGGESAVSAAVAAAIRDLGVETVTRLAGDSRYGTAAAVGMRILRGDGDDVPATGLLQSGQEAGPDVIVASGEAFPDALVAGPLAGLSGRIIVLTRPEELPAETEELLQAINPARAIVAGGQAAVSEAVASRLAAEFASSGVVERLGGDSRFATAEQLIERTIREGGLTDRAYLVSGGDFPDALAAGAAVAHLGGMLLPMSSTVPASGGVGQLLARRADGLVEVIYVGGSSALPQDLRDRVEALVLARRTR